MEQGLRWSKKLLRLKGKGKKEDVLGFAVIRVTES
jgi:hypothetical protein